MNKKGLTGLSRHCKKLSPFTRSKGASCRPNLHQDGIVMDKNRVSMTAIVRETATRQEEDRQGDTVHETGYKTRGTVL